MAKKQTASGNFTVSITEVTISGGPHRNIRVTIDGQVVLIPVSAEVYAYWQEQFVRQNPTPAQRKRFATMMSVVRAAYVTGQNAAQAGGAAV